MFERTLLSEKIYKSKTIFFFDFDGTLFTPDKKVLTAPFYNIQIKLFLEKYHIPFVIVTGRSNWTRRSELLTRLLGLPNPDAVITGAGTLIYYRMQDNQLGLDTSWAKVMHQSNIQLQEKQNIPWNTATILNTIKPILPVNVSVRPKNSNTHLIRLYADGITIQELLHFKKTLATYTPHGVRILFTEKLLKKNTTEIFTGDILLIPEHAGKDHAIRYMLQNLSHFTNKSPINAFCFGDATIDVDMLSIKSQQNTYSMHTYGVNLQPLTNEILLEKQSDNPQLHIVETPHSPQAILNILRSLSFRADPAMAREVKESHTKEQKDHFSPAQNNLARRFFQPFEGILNNLFDKHMTANDISIKGLNMVKESIDLLYADKKPNMSTKIKALKLYIAGNVADLLDGIRARKNKNQKNIIPSTYEVPGQLLDTYCDRAKEFYQLYKRALNYKRVIPAHLPAGRQEHGIYTNEKFYQTLLTAISCILPSLARAQAETQGIIVPEKDAQGGSMLDRTKNLFQAFIYDLTGLHHKSFTIDQKIYQSNLATFDNRLSHLNKKVDLLSLRERIKGRGKSSENSTDISDDFQQKALERFFLLTQLVQEENKIIEKELQTHPRYLEEYKKEFQKRINQYLSIHIEKLRKQYNIPNYKKLSIKL